MVIKKDGLIYKPNTTFQLLVSTTHFNSVYSRMIGINIEPCKELPLVWLG